MDFEHVIHYKELLLRGKTGPWQGKYVSKYHARNGRRSARPFTALGKKCLLAHLRLPTLRKFVNIHGQSSGHWQRMHEYLCSHLSQNL